MNALGLLTAADRLKLSTCTSECAERLLARTHVSAAKRPYNMCFLLNFGNLLLQKEPALHQFCRNAHTCLLKDWFKCPAMLHTGAQDTVDATSAADS